LIARFSEINVHDGKARDLIIDGKYFFTLHRAIINTLALTQARMHIAKLEVDKQMGIVQICVEAAPGRS